ncbi:SRPBCC family protein [Sporichthya brevicatena]|uniref:SRPBCC family protein n=1 Tax=Sporichthya brevicatena TaxID=171442 RepID=A0ABN1GMI8_9ACTN
MKDLIAELTTVARRVEREGDHAGVGREGDVYVVELRRTYDAEPADVWDAITDPERIGRWFARVSGDLRLGGRYAIEGNASGAITACDPPKRLALDWEFAGATSWVSVDLTPVEGDRCELVLRHRQPRSEHWATYGPGATGVGWDLSLLGLAWHLQGVENTAAEFEAHPGGRDFIRGAATSWGEAHQAAGAPAEAASRAAQATADAFAPPA